MDEKGFLLGQTQNVKVIVCQRLRNSRFCQDGNQAMVTVIETVSADSQVLPPKLIYKGSAH
jgi:hypothetical protein